MPCATELRSSVLILVPAIAAILIASAGASQAFDIYATAQTPPAELAGRGCRKIADAARQPNKDVCVSAHVYSVVELPDGTRFLDVCPADLPDGECRFTLVSLNVDREDVGDLRKYRDQDVNVRGVVRATRGRMGIQISHIRQFNGGPEKFRPSPKLLRDFNGQSDRTPVRDPNLAGSGRHRSFMNTADKEQPQAGQKR